MTKSPTRIITFMSMAIAINYIGANIALFLRLPIYLDMIGTLLVSVALGPGFGLLAATISALLSWMTTDIFAIYFAPVAIVASLMAGIVIKPSTSIAHLLWKSLLVSLPGTIVASMITVLLFNGITSSGSSLIAQLLQGLGLDMTTSLIIVQLGTDYLDRLISLILVLIILRVQKKHITTLIN